MAQPSAMTNRWISALGWLWLPLLAVSGVILSLLFATSPRYAAALVIALAGLYSLYRNFELTVIGLLLLRSVLDMYSLQQIPAAFAIALILLVFLYIARQLFTRRPVKTDPLWWFLLLWVILQGAWVALVAFGGLGGEPYFVYDGVREWTRLFSLVMVYLLVMQLQGRVSSQQLTSVLFLSVALPLGLAMLQLSGIPLPGFLQSNVAWASYATDSTRISSTLGHYNSFATFSLLFMALAFWRAQVARWPWGWWLLGLAMLYCVFLSRSLTGMVMLVVFATIYVLPKLKGRGWIGAIALGFGLIFLLSSDLAQSRLLELNQTPLLNPDLSVSRAIALQAADMDEFRNSFNWRLLQWRDLLTAWREHPWLGYGLASAEELSTFDTTSHNDYIRFLVEEGIVGLGLFITFLSAQAARLIWLMRNSRPRSPQQQLAFTLFAFLVSMAVGMAAGNVMVHTATLFYWWTVVAIAGWNWAANAPLEARQVPATLPASQPLPIDDIISPGSPFFYETASADAWRSEWAHSTDYDPGASTSQAETLSRSKPETSMTITAPPIADGDVGSESRQRPLSPERNLVAPSDADASPAATTIDVYDPQTYQYEGDILDVDAAEYPYA